MERQTPDQVTPSAIAYVALALMIPCAIVALRALHLGWSNVW